MIPTPLAIHAKAEPIERGYFLKAIAEVESGLDMNKIGAKGERSAWQITKTVWKAHMTSAYPFEDFASVPEVSAICARARFDWIIAGLARHQVPATPENVASCWHRGLAGTLHRIGLGMRPDDYSIRVANLYRAEMAVAPAKIQR